MPSLIATLDATDRALSARLRARPAAGHPRAWLAIVHRVSQTGSYGVGWIALFAVVATMLEGPAAAAVAATCVVGTLGVNTLVKLLVRRPRPADNPVGHQPSTHSMPSAHTAMAVVGAASMTLIAPSAVVLWWAWAAVLAWSRIVLGMHYVGDVLVGALLGALLAWLVAAPALHAAGV